MPELARRLQPLLGTFVEVSVPERFAGNIDLAFSTIREIHRLMSFHEPESDLGRINRAAAGESITCDPKTIEVITLSRSLYQQSNGHFDISIAPELVRHGYLPGPGASLRHARLGRQQDITIESATRLRLRRQVWIDLGGIAKGYAVDCAIEALCEAGVPAALVNAGGDLRCYGPDAWPVWLQEPCGSPEKMLNLSNGALASSANLRTRKRRLFGYVSPHIGRDRRPLLSDSVVSVRADRCAIADALTKVAMVDVDLANRLLTGHEGYVLQPGPEPLEMSA